MANHRRHSTRLHGYDYTQAGAYFVTICTHQRLPLFGHISAGVMMLSTMGVIVESEWLQTVVVREYVELDAFVIMPNHMHGIIILHDDPVGATRRVAPTHNPPHSTPANNITLPPGSLGAIIGQFKSIVTKRIRQNFPNPPDRPIWQRNYHDHIIRSETELNRLREYVLHNPARWQEDTFFV